MSGYTVVKTAHRCPARPDLPPGSIVQCQECGTRWLRTILGWLPQRETS